MKRITAALLVFCAASSFAQVAPAVVNCGTMEQDSINRLKFPQRGTLEEFENALQKKMRDIAFSGGRTKAGVLTLPVIVHVVHTGEAIGTGANISQAQVMAQIEVLNEDFRRKAGSPGFNNNLVGADIEVEFCLSPVDEAGKPLTEPGIERIRASQATWTKDQVDGTLKPSTIWNPNQFFNIWTLKFGGQDSNLLGYAQFPDQSGLSGLNQTGGPASTDGVVVQYTSFGSVDKGTFPVMTAPYNHGRTLSHETGHWLGLRHIWGDGPCGNDFVDDTPTAHAENRGCPVNKLSCDNNSNEMPQNYMDYSDDGCMNIFTKGQKARIHAVLELSPRRKSITQNNLCSNVVVTAPVASFTSDKQTVLSGGEVVFADLSTNFPTSWQWTFEGGNPNTSNVQNPRVKYPVAGTYKVTLIASNTVGSSAPFEIDDYISVSSEGLCGTITNFSDQYTPSLLKISKFANFTGYLTGHSSAKNKAISEFFVNPQGYAYINAVRINFGKAYSPKEDATVTVTVWNARGPQSSPGSVIERKTVLIKQIKQDVATGGETIVSFDRETPVFSRPFHVGIELKYEGDSLAITSSANGEATNSTSWVQGSNGAWAPYAIAYGANIAMDVSPVVGMNTSVQVSASKLLVNPGEEVILNARGASIFVWNSSDDQVNEVAGPQLAVHPVTTTEYETTGSGVELCNAKTVTKIFVREGTVTKVDDVVKTSLALFPNPGRNSVEMIFDGDYVGPVSVLMTSTLGQQVRDFNFQKESPSFSTSIDTSSLSAGLYVISVKAGERIYRVKWVKE